MVTVSTFWTCSVDMGPFVSWCGDVTVLVALAAASADRSPGNQRLGISV
jgi:hypothetical protein